MSMGPVMTALTPLAMGLLADARRARVWLLRGGSIATACAFAFFFRARPGASIYLVFALFSLFRAPLSSLADATAVEIVRRDGGSYGRLRLWGSIGFLVAVAAGGPATDLLGLRSLLGLTTATLFVAAASAFAIPAPPPEARPHVLRAWSTMLAAPEAWLFVAAVVLGQVACSAYDGCFSLHLTRLGHGAGFVGAAWAIGVAAEVGVLAASGRLMARHGAARLFAFALGVASLRWLLLAHVTDGPLLLVLQPLHGITFGCFHAGAVTLMRDRAPTAAPTAAQGLYYSAAGVGSVLGLSLAGRLLDTSGAPTLFTCASISAAGAFACAATFAQRSRAAPIVRRAAA
jgi:MFS transporter, PPP family, 3-phenylpropionic acid transporter